jgi:biopolymer transport protein ExbD
MNRLALVLALAACGHKASQSQSSECSDVLDDPAHAEGWLSAKYPHDAVKVMTIIEDCVAPTGTPCERVARILERVPTLMPGAADIPAARAACERAPAALQRCFLLSYALAHDGECKPFRDQQLASIDIEPSPLPPPAPAPPDCPETHVYIDVDHLAYGRDRKIPLPARKDDIMNFSGLEAGLRRLATDCIGPLSVSAAPRVAYQDVIDVMDLANKVGFQLVLLDTGDDTPVPPTPPPPDGKSALQVAPVIAISSLDLQVDGVSVAHPDDADVTAAVHAALAAAPADKHAGLVILSAVPATTARTIVQTVVAARQAGFGSVMFAVKKVP